MIKIGSKPFWRSVTLLLAVTGGWIAWVSWQALRPPLATELAFRSQPAHTVASSLPSPAVAMAHKTSKQPLWVQLSARQQMVLRPLQHHWDHLSDPQRKRLLSTAGHYPNMSKQQQERYSSRLLQWSKITIEERTLARKRYLEYSRLPGRARQKIAALSKEQQATSAQEISSETDSSASGSVPPSAAKTEDSKAGDQTR